ncbi:ATP-binding cassette sub-family A member 13 [Puma concolor]|uniref:ATP-binding cassette sub-family A member 13 n=1 Tax=Puma concolor TaxID=9696 RepID=A0A6P6HTL3_PUMCO|nr:ATP-binding cassette sub-family A member 13 [Puma concolor]
MGPAGRQFGALIWKNWLCRLRHPVLSLAEFFWPCILFMILTVLRFQEPPRHRDNCFLQPRDLPSRGVFPFVQGLLCNTGSTCRNQSYEGATEHHSRSSRFWAAAGRPGKVNDLAFLEEVRELAEEVYDVMDKAKILQELWAGRSKGPDSPHGSSFLAIDLNKTEEVISKLEKLHQQPHIWNFLRLLPRLYAHDTGVADRIRTGIRLLQAALNSLATLEDLDWLPLDHRFSTISEIALNVTVSMLTFLQEQGAATPDLGYTLSLKKLVWDPQKVQADLKSRFGFDDLHAEQILNYSVELQEIPTDGTLERMVCSVLSRTSEDEAGQEGHPGDCHPRWSAATDYLVHAVSWLQVYKQVFDQWQKGSLLQKVLEGAARSLEALGDQFVEETEPRKVLEALHTLLLILSDGLAADDPSGDHSSPKTHSFQPEEVGNPAAHACSGHRGCRLYRQDLLPQGDEMRERLAGDRLLRELIAGLTDTPVSVPGGFLGWQEVETQLADMGLSCTRLFRVLGAAGSPGNNDFAGDCEDQLLAAAVFHSLEQVQLSLEETSYWKAFEGFIRKTCELVRYVNAPESVQNGLSAFSEESPCYEENMDWEIITDNYFDFLSNLLKSPAASIARILNSSKELLLMEKRLHSPEDEQMHFFLSLVGFLEKLLPNPFDSPRVPKSRDRPSPTKTLLNTSHLWVNHSRSLERDPSALDTQKLLELGKAVIARAQALERLWTEKESHDILRFMELVLSEMNPKLLELWTDGISKGERDTLETLTTGLNFSVPEDERVLSKSFNFSQLFHSDWPPSPSVKMDFVHLCETVLSSLYEFGFLRQGQVSEALDVVCALRNLSERFSALPEPEKREVAKILTQLYLSVFQDKDSALLLQIYSSWFQSMSEFLSIQGTDSLLPSLAQISKHILDIIKQFHFQNISEAFAFLYETTGVLEGISEGSYCQQLLSFFNYLELQARSLVSTQGPELEVIHATLTGLKQLLVANEDFRISFFQYMSQFFNGSVEALLGNECFALDSKNVSSVNYSTDRGSSFILPWAQILSNLSANGSVFNELMAVRCTVSWLQMWTDIWGSISQIFKFGVNIFTPLHDGLTQLLDELEGDVKVSKSCQRMFPTHHPARLILNLFKNVTQADGFHDWDEFLSLRDLWVVVGDALVSVKSLNPDQVEKSLFTMETALSQLKTFPLNTNASREFLYSLLDVFMELSDTSEYIDRDVQLLNHFLSNNLTNHGMKFESVIKELRETMLLLRNVSRDQDLLSCANIFQNVTEFILEDGLLYVNISQRTLHILAMLNSTFSSEDTSSRRKGCVAWVDIMNHLYMMYNSSVSQGYPRGIWKSFRDVENKINSTLKLVTGMLNIKDPHCSFNMSDPDCVNTVLKNVTDFLNVILTEVFEEEKVPKLEILLTLLNDSTDQVRMIINNLTRDFDFVSQSHWKRFTGFVLRPKEMSDDLPSRFKNLWLHLVALGKEVQKLMKAVSTHILESDSSSTSEKLFNVFATSLKEKDVNSLGNSLYQLASYLAFNFSYDLQHPPQMSPHKITKAVGLGIQLMRDVFNSLTPSVLHNIPRDAGNSQVFKKVTSLLRTLKKPDIDLLVDQLVQMNEALTDFFKNVSRLGPGRLGANLLVGLLEKFVDSSHSWNVNHLLKLSRLFPKDDVNAVVDAYYVLPHAVKLLQRGVDKNITEILEDVYKFTVLHGISISNITKEDFAIVLKTLLDTVELISDKPAILSEALTCLPVVWCWNHTTSGSRQDPKVEACRSHELTSSSFYRKVARVLDLLHLSPVGGGLQCSDEGSQEEISRTMVCVIHELVDWTSIFLELSEVFHVQTSLVKTMREFWHKVLPFVPSSGNQSNGGISELCPHGPLKQVASQIIATLKSVSFTKVAPDEKILDTLANLSKILNINEGTEASVQNKISLNLERIMKLPSGDRHLENGAHSVDSPFVMFLDANVTDSGLEAPSFTKTSEVTYNSSYFEELWLEVEQIMTELSHDFPIRHLVSEINKEIQMINSETVHNITLQLARVFESLGSLSLKTSEIIEDFLLGMKNWLHKRANKHDSRMIETLFLLTANKNATDDTALWIKDFATFLGFLKAISREGDLDVAHLTQLLSQEQLTNLSLVQFLFESVLINSISKLAGSSLEAASNSSDTDLQITNFINLTLNQTPSGNGAGIILPPRSAVDFMEQLLQTFFSFLLEENSENRLSLLLKAFHKDIAAEMSFVPKDKILEILSLDQFLTILKDDRLMSIFSSLKDAIHHLIQRPFILDNGQFHFDIHRGLKFMRDLFSALPRETSGTNKSEDNLEFLMVVSHLLRHGNSSEDLFQLNHDLRSALQLVRETSTELARLMDALTHSPHRGFRNVYPALREVILANLTGLLSFINNSFPLRNRTTLEMTKRFLGVLSRAGGGSGAPEPLLEMTDTMTLLVRDIADMRDLASSVNSAVELVRLAQKVSRKVATIFEAHFISSANDTVKFFDSLYSVLQQSVRNAVNEIMTLKNVDRFPSEKINNLLTPFLDLAFGMTGVTPNISQDSDIVNTSSSTFSHVNQSKDFSDISEEIAEFLTSVKINLGAMELLLVAFNNATQIFHMDSVNLWEEILDCFVPISSIINQIDFLHPRPLPTHCCPQGTKWERTQEVILFLDEMLSRDSTEIGTYLRMAIDLTLEALWSNLEKDNRSVFNLLLTLVQHPDDLLKAIETAGEVSGGTGDLSEALFSNASLIPNVTRQQLEQSVQIMLRRIALLRKEFPLNNSQWVDSMRTLFQPIFESFINAATGKNTTSGKEESIEEVMADFPYILKPLSSFEKYLKELIALTECWQEVPLMDQSVAMCRIFQQPRKPPEAVATLQKVTMLALHLFLILAGGLFLALCRRSGFGCLRDGLAQSLEETWLSGNPVMAFLRNFTVTEDVRVKDVMQNVSKLTRELQSSIHVSNETIHSVLEASISHSQVLWSILAVALSGRCDLDALRLLLAFPEDGKSGSAVREVCALPGPEVYSLIVSMSQNLNLRSFIYKTLMPLEASRVLSSLLDVLSRLSHLLAKAGHVLEYLPEFLRVNKITALLDTPDFQQDPQNGQARSSAFGSFQSVMKKLCKEPASFFSGSNSFINLPRVNELLGGDKEKFNIPEDSTPFCLNLYQEILQSPNGALVWSFLKPVLHGKILYTPNTPEINEIIGKANYTFHFLDKLKTLTETLLEVSSVFQSGGSGQMLSKLQAALRNKFIRNFVESQLHIDVDKLMEKLQTYGVIFNSSLGSRDLGTPSLRPPPHVTYTIRTSVLHSMRTDLVKNPFWKFHPQNLPADVFKYNYIFVPLQDMIERAIISVQTGQEAEEPATQTQAMPYPCHTRDLFLNNVGFFFPLIMMLTWMVSVASMVRKLVYEREIQIEEYVRMMGVHPTILFLAWFLENMAMLAISSAALAIILKVSGIFAHSNACIIFLFLLDFAVSVVMLSYFLSTFFSQANTAALCTSLVYMISFLPYIVLLVLRNQLSVVIQTFLVRIQWNNMYQPLEQTGVTFGWVSWMILFDSGLYFVCGWYLNNLLPGTFGLRKPWYFPFTASYWRNLGGFLAKRPHAPSSNLSFSSENFDDKGSSLPIGEGKPGGPPGVALLSVTKEYERHKAAVRDLTLTFHRGQITVLLGTNGAGKTTVISMLTGLHPPTSGTITVNGRNLQTDLSAIRRELGVCPQRDVLFDNLTVLEHLVLFASIKAPQWTRKELCQQVNRTLRDVELTPHRHKQTRVLSGGMKRKLAIGIAFIGASGTVVLDEPTSGVDPCSRRSIWDILLKYREGRTIIFTTHHLDEAEALGDRVALLQHGRLRCCGPPFCLTQAYGQGLSLTLSKQPSAPETDDLKHVTRATSLIQTYIPQAFLRDSSGAELVYGIPKDADRACFKGLFQTLEQNLDHLHLTGFGISDATLEEVFLTLLQGSKKQSDAALGAGVEPRDHGPPEHCKDHFGNLGRPATQNVSITLAQAGALLVKRFQHTRRAWRSSLSDLLLPVLFVALAMGLFMVRPLAIDYPPLKLTPGHYDTAETYFFSSGTEDQELIHVLLRAFADEDPLCDDAPKKNSSCWRVDPSSHPQVQDSCTCLTCLNRSAGAPYLTNHLGHTLLNLSAFHLEEYLLVPSEKSRLGGWSFGVRIPDQVQGADANTSEGNSVAKVWYSQKGFHSLPSYLNHLNNLILWTHLPPAADWRQYGVTLYSHPYGGALLNEDKIMESIRQCGVALCIVLGFSILSASIGSSVVRDRVTGAKRLQHISGLGYRTYWLANFLYDMCSLEPRKYATLPWMYLMSRIFSSSDVAFISYVSLNFIFGLCTLLMTIMPRLLAIISKAQSLQNIYDVLKWVFIVFPQFCLGQGLIELCYNQIKYDLTHSFGVDSYVSPFEMNFLGWTFVQLASQGTVLLILRVLLHWDLLQRPRGHAAIQGTVTFSKDVDVEREQIRVLKGRTSEDLLVLCNLSKSYGGFFKKTTAVQDISMGIRRGECFGLLGVNGAGKSTTFKMLNGDTPPTSGHVVARTPTGETVDLSLAGTAGVRMGYCPQQDALDEFLTGWEHLRYYCTLRGVPNSCISQVARDLVRRLHLEAHVDKLVATYSGGTKRKLSTALALLGRPDLLLLGAVGLWMCVWLASGFMWGMWLAWPLCGLYRVYVQPHMEECQALCTRLAIMVNGSFRCLGSPQHLKSRFGDGYTVKIWLCKETSPHSVVSDCLKLHFPGIQFKGQRLNLLEYHVPKQWECLADLFRVLEGNKTFLNIQRYSINQTTLEQVFINFVTEQQKASPCTRAPSTGCHQPDHLPI